jgi:hypothetical protein
MIRATIKGTLLKDDLADLANSLKQLSEMDALVGIPESTAARKKGKITNAQLLFIHTNGSPIRKIPKRPVIEPAIAASDNQDKIVAEMNAAQKAMLDEDAYKAIVALKRAGMIGRDAAKSWFTDPRNNWPPNAYSTALAKYNKAMKYKRSAQAASGIVQGLIAQGKYKDWKDAIRDVSVSRPLIDTGALRQSITYAIRTGPGKALELGTDEIK